MLMRSWVGPVSSEKTTRALRAARRFERLGTRVVLIRPKRSVRKHEEAGTLRTKTGEAWPSIDLASAWEIPTAFDGARQEKPAALWLDEPMLFEQDAGVKIAVERIRPKHPILVSGLGATSEMTAFGTVTGWLLSVSDEVIWCKADCDGCGRIEAATRSFSVTPKNHSVKVGGEESYLALCWECWNKRTEERTTLAG